MEIMKLFKDKKGQYYQQQPKGPYANIHPILIVGIIITVLRFLLPIMGIKNGIEWMFWLGLIVILVGGFLSALNSAS